MFGIYERLGQILDSLRSNPATAAPIQEKQAEPIDPLEALKRQDLIARVGALPSDAKPRRWPRLTNAELVDILRKEGAK